jgi:hypothetical protein
LPLFAANIAVLTAENKEGFFLVDWFIRYSITLVNSKSRFAAVEKLPKSMD